MPILTPPQTFTFQRWQSGCWYSPSSSSGTILGLGNGIARAAAIYIPNVVTINAVACEVTVAGSSGTIRLGIWADNGAFPGTLLLDVGTIDSTSVAVQSLVISKVLTPGIYWLGGVVQGAPGTEPTVRAIGGVGLSFGQMGINQATAPTTAGQSGYTSSGMTGALTNWTGTLVNNAGNVPRVFVRVA